MNWSRLDGDKLQCTLCPRDCRLSQGQRGMCFVRQREGDRIVLTAYGKASGFALDPIEKKPLNHFYPGTSVLSFGTAGCNLACKFCQNWDISKSRDMERLSDEATPEAIADAAKRHGARSVAFTYNDPTIFAEYAMDVADAAHARGLATVAVSAGYIYPEPRAELYAKIDAANIDLKAFTDEFYWKQAAAHLEPVKDTLRYLVKETQVWTEITTLLIPTLNDSDKELHELAQWVASELGPDVPLHFSAFHPDYKLRDLPPTPPATLTRARRIAMAEGLRFVYTGNVHDQEGDQTLCPGCGTAVISRDWYEILDAQLTPKGACAQCGTQIPGRFGEAIGNFGRKRMRVLV
ncbi:MAG TPA: AmmeMemoRadiSam system radical SAM enzyme [Kofleriaceae bacterium]|nr:AmmeMemoRadiSam system radical SAM enzyme [Kofleriaceae bacterium]